jgi:uncharacterized protein
MKILMTGGTGLIGQEVGKKLVALGHEVTVVTRDKKTARQNLSFKATLLECDLNTKALSSADFNGIDVIVNLLGETVDGRWTAQKKKLIYESRINSAQNLLKNCPETVKTVVTASAQGIYGDRKNEEVNESSFIGSGFLADVCKDWEREFSQNVKSRLVILRIGLVLSRKGGALKKLVNLFLNNLGANLANGEQWMSWISLEDLSDLFVKACTDNQMQGIYNAVNDSPVTNAEFTKTLCEELNVMQLPSVPSFVLKGVLGEMSELVLSSAKIKPARLIQELKYSFKHTSLEEFFKEELKVHQGGHSLFYAEQFIESSPEKVFKFFGDAYNLDKITPKILNFKIKNVSTAQVEKDTLIDYELKIRGLPVFWRTKIAVWDFPHQFIDTQLKGPYKFWHHTHTFKEVSGGVLMIDEVKYKLPIGLLGRLVAGAFVDSDVSDIFKYRREVISEMKFD